MNPPKRQNRWSRPPREGPAFRTRLSQWARRRVGRSPRQPRPPSAQQPFSRDERRKRTNDCAGKKRKMTISRPLAETSLDSRPNSALECRQNGAWLCRRSYRPTAPSGMGHDTRPSRTPRAPSPCARNATATPNSPAKLVKVHDHETPWQTAGRGGRLSVHAPWSLQQLTTDNVSRAPTQRRMKAEG